jgi:hypothetical protein
LPKLSNGPQVLLITMAPFTQVSMLHTLVDMHGFI